MKTKKTRALKFYLRLLIGLVLLAVLLKSVDRAALLEHMARLDGRWILWGALVIVGLRVLMSMRWQDVLALQGIDVGLRELVRITFISFFFGHFLPGGVGTDVVRGAELISRRGRTADITATLILDRFIGVYSMFFVALIGSAIGYFTGRLENMIGYLLIAQVLILGGWYFGFRIYGRLGKAGWFEGTRWEKSWTQCLLILKSVTDLPRIRRIFLKVFLLSVLVQLGRCLLFFCLFHALGEGVSLVDCLTLIPLVYVIVLAPISVAGLGVREGALTYFFLPLGVAAEISIGVGLVSHVLQILVAVPGVFFWLVDRREMDKQAA